MSDDGNVDDDAIAAASTDPEPTEDATQATTEAENTSNNDAGSDENGDVVGAMRPTPADSAAQGGQSSDSKQQNGNNGADFTAPPAEEGESNYLQSAVVPRLDDLLIKCLAENYDVYPALDRIPAEYLDNVVALLDPSQIEFSVAAKYITTEKFWKRLCQERWPICQIASHGLSWKRLYIERHLQSLFEAYYPSSQGQNFERLMKEVSAGKPYVQTINIQQLLSHLDLSDILIEFPNLSTLTLKYGARKLGMDYDKSLFGMQLKDAMYLSKFLGKTNTLNRLTLTENLLNDESIHILSSGTHKQHSFYIVHRSERAFEAIESSNRHRINGTSTHIFFYF